LMSSTMLITFFGWADAGAQIRIRIPKMERALVMTLLLGRKSSH
jgi:hypothetical protein